MWSRWSDIVLWKIHFIIPPLDLILAWTINPLFVVLLIIAPLLHSHRRRAWNFWLVAALSIALSELVTESGKYYLILPGHDGFPSGHTTFALAASVSLIWQDRRWLIWVIPLMCALTWALVSAGFHTRFEVAGAFLVAIPIPLACHFLLRRLLRQDQRPSSRHSTHDVWEYINEG